MRLAVDVDGDGDHVNKTTVCWGSPVKGFFFLRSKDLAEYISTEPSSVEYSD